MKRLIAALLLVSLAPALPGCSVYQAYAQRQAIQQARFHLKNVAVQGFDLSGANLAVTLEIENPTNTQIVLDRLDYTIFLNEQRMVGGFTDRRITVPASDVRPVTFTTFVRFADVGAQLQRVVTQGITSYRLEGVGHFDTPFGTIDYPVRLLGPES